MPNIMTCGNPGSGYTPMNWRIADELDGDEELDYTISRNNEYAGSYMTRDEARQVAHAILAAIGEPVNGPVVAPSGVTETRVKEIVREVMRDTFN